MLVRRVFIDLYSILIQWTDNLTNILRLLMTYFNERLS